MIKEANYKWLDLMWVGSSLPFYFLLHGRESGKGAIGNTTKKEPLRTFLKKL